MYLWIHLQVYFRSLHVNMINQSLRFEFFHSLYPDEGQQIYMFNIYMNNYAHASHCTLLCSVSSWSIFTSADAMAYHYDDVIMGAIASQITSLTIVYSTVYSGADQSKHQSSASLAFVWGIHRGPLNSPHKWPVTRKMFPFDDVIMCQWSNTERHMQITQTK